MLNIFGAWSSRNCVGNEVFDIFGACLLQNYVGNEVLDIFRAWSLWNCLVRVRLIIFWELVIAELFV